MSTSATTSSTTNTAASTSSSTSSSTISTTSSTTTPPLDLPPKTSRQPSQPQPHPALAPDGPLQILLEGRNFRAYFGATDTRKDRVFIWYQPDVGLLGNLYWCESGQQASRQELEEKSLPVVKISDVYLGKKSPELKSVAAKNAPEERCFTLVTKSIGGTVGKSLHLECASEQTRSAWLAALSAVFQLPMRDQTKDRDYRRANGLIAGLAKDLDGIRTGYESSRPDRYGVYRNRPNFSNPSSVPGTPGQTTPRIDPVTGQAITPRTESGTIRDQGDDQTETIVEVGVGTQEAPRQLNVHDKSDNSYDEAVVVAAVYTKKGEEKVQEEKKDEKLKLPSVETAIYVLTTGTKIISYYDPTGNPASNEPAPPDCKDVINVESKEMFCFGHFFDDEGTSADVSPTSSFALYWCKPGERGMTDTERLQFKDITDLYHGKKTKMFTHSPTTASVDARRCFSVSAPNIALHVALSDERERNDWFFSLYRLLLASTTVETTGSGELADSVARMIAEDLEWQKERDREAQEWASKDKSQFTK